MTIVKVSAVKEADVPSRFSLYSDNLSINLSVKDLCRKEHIQNGRVMTRL